MTYTKAELKHLRWRFITQDGLKPAEADARIKELLDWTNKTEKKTLKQGKKRNKTEGSRRKNA